MSNSNPAARMGGNTQRLVFCAVMIALATVLSFIKLWEMPLGGEITLCAMLPILVAGYRYGIRWGLLTGFAYSLIKLLLDAGLLSGFAGMSWQSVLGSALLDYLVAFTVLGLAGIYGHGFFKFILGILTAVVLRFISHVISGCIIFYAYAFDSGSFPKNLAFLRGHVFLYSAAYNGFYLLPDLILCLIAAALLYKPLKRFLEN